MSRSCTRTRGMASCERRRRRMPATRIAKPMRKPANACERFLASCKSHRLSRWTVHLAHAWPIVVHRRSRWLSLSDAVELVAGANEDRAVAHGGRGAEVAVVARESVHGELLEVAARRQDIRV